MQGAAQDDHRLHGRTNARTYDFLEERVLKGHNVDHKAGQLRASIPISLISSPYNGLGI